MNDKPLPDAIKAACKLLRQYIMPNHSIMANPTIERFAVH